MSRYVQAEVDESIAQVERGVFTPHAQIVLAAEVEALRADASNREILLQATLDQRDRLRVDVEQHEAERDRLQATRNAWSEEVASLAGQLTALREAASALVEHIDRKYYDTVAPSQAAIERHAELGRFAIGVLATLQPPAAEVERG